MWAISSHLTLFLNASETLLILTLMKIVHNIVMPNMWLCSLDINPLNYRDIVKSKTNQWPYNTKDKLRYATMDMVNNMNENNLVKHAVISVSTWKSSLRLMMVLLNNIFCQTWKGFFKDIYYFFIDYIHFSLYYRFVLNYKTHNVFI